MNIFASSAVICYATPRTLWITPSPWTVFAFIFRLTREGKGAFKIVDFYFFLLYKHYSFNNVTHMELFVLKEAIFVIDGSDENDKLEKNNNNPQK